MKPRVKMPGKLSHQLIFWFLMALLGPLLVLQYLTLNSWNTRQELARKIVTETQSSWVQKLEDFYHRRFLPVYQEALRKSLGSFPEDLARKDVDEATRLYHQMIFGQMGFESVGLENEPLMPIRVQFNSLNPTGESWKIYDWFIANIEGLSHSRGDRLLSEALNDFRCVRKWQEPVVKKDVLKLWENCGHVWADSLQGAFRERGSDLILTEILKTREIWLKAVLKYRRGSPPQEREVLEELLLKQWPFWLEDEVRDEFRRDLNGETPESTVWLRWLDRLDPFRINFHSIARYKGKLSIQDPGVHLDVWDVRSGGWRFAGKKYRQLEDIDGWAIFGNLFLRVREAMVLGEMALKEEDLAVLAYMGLNLDIENRQFTPAETNQGVFSTINEYFPLDYDPWSFFSGIGFQPEGIFLCTIDQSQMKKLFIDAVLLAQKLGREGPGQDLLHQRFEAGGHQMNFSGARPEILELWRELLDFASGKEAERKLAQEEFSSFSMGRKSLGYALGVLRDNPWLLPRSLEWQRQFWVSSEPVVDRRGNRGTLSQASLVKQRIDSGHQEEIGRRLTSMLKQGSFGFLEYRYEYQGRAWLVMAIRSQVFSNQVLFLQLSEAVALQEQQTIRFILSALLILTLLVCLFLGRALIQRIVIPVGTLRERVLHYQPGQMVKSVPLGVRDEVFAMSRGFEDMARRIRRRLEETGAIQALNEKMLQGQSLFQLMEEGTASLRSALDADFAYLIFFEETSREKAMEETMSLRPGISVKELASDLSRLVRSEKLEAGILRECILGEYKTQYSCYLCPVSFSEGGFRIQGVLVLGNSQSDVMAQEEQAFLKSYLIQLITVVTKAWLDRLRVDNLQGREVQLSLLPGSTPQMQGMELASFFEAAKFLGGDFYDFLEFPGSQKIGLVISDVSGKGIGPALFGASCKSSLQVLKDEEQEPGALLARLNDFLCEEKDHSLFATIFLVILDLQSGVLKFASAGHNRMFCYRSREKRLEELNGKGLPVGMFSPGKYSTETLELEKGDWLFLYTDGINELENRDLELYGMERLTTFLEKELPVSTPEEVLNLLSQELGRFQEGVAASDDMTCIALKYTGA